MRNHVKNAVVLWTGGKDSAMALHEARHAGYHLEHLVTFAPSDPHFSAHPLVFIRLQAEALGLPHTTVIVDPPFESGYEAALRNLCEEMQIDTVVTGDIGQVDGHPNWIRERCRAVAMNVFMPLWGRDRKTLLQQLLTGGFKACISCVRGPLLTPDWVGRGLDRSAISELEILCADRDMDLCGEQGEYHTLVTDGPGFAREIRIGAYSRRSEGALTYMEIPFCHL